MKTKLKVTGMSCENCVQSVTKTLRDVEGVHDAKVDLASGIADVDFDETKTDVEALCAAVADIGFDAAAAQ